MHIKIVLPEELADGGECCCEFCSYEDAMARFEWLLRQPPTAFTTNMKCEFLALRRLAPQRTNHPDG